MSGDIQLRSDIAAARRMADQAFTNPLEGAEMRRSALLSLAVSLEALLLERQTLREALALAKRDEGDAIDGEMEAVGRAEIAEEALRQIADFDAEHEQGYLDEWAQADSFQKVQEIARVALRGLQEQEKPQS
jgi:hypothetical protein